MNLPSILNIESTIRDWLDDPKGKVAFGPIYEKMREQMNSSMGSSDTIGMDMTGFMMEMPPLSILQFQQKSWDSSPHEIMEGLLQQVHSQ